jgi:AraC-like DNA-binding protein
MQVDVSKSLHFHPPPVPGGVALRVAALVPRDHLASVRIQFGSGEVLAVHDASDLRRAMRGFDRGIFIADPELLGDDHARCLCADVAGHEWRLVLYCDHSGRGLTATLRALEWHPSAIVIRFDDSLGLRHPFVRDNTRSIELVRRIDSHLRALPAQTAMATIAVITASSPTQSCLEFATASKQSLRTLSRQLATAGLASPRVLILVGRFVGLYDDLVNVTLSMEAVADRWGFQSVRTLSRHVREVTGRTPGFIRRRPLSRSELIHIAAAMIIEA